MITIENILRDVYGQFNKPKEERRNSAGWLKWVGGEWKSVLYAGAVESEGEGAG